MLVELYDLDLQKNQGVWAETARWIKYEEDVEGADHHWGQPHVAFLSFHALLSLRKAMRSGPILFDSRAKTFVEVCEQIASALIIEGVQCKRDEVLSILTMKQTHPLRRRMTRLSFAGSLFEKHSEGNLSARNTDEWMGADGKSHHLNHSATTTTATAPSNSMSESKTGLHTQPTIIEIDDNESAIARSSSRAQFQRQQRSVSMMARTPSKTEHFFGIKRPTVMDFAAALAERKITSTHDKPEMSSVLLKKLPEGTESTQVFVGMISKMTRTHFVMIRLAEAVRMQEILEGEIPVKFFIAILGPQKSNICYHELGRSIATLMADREFNAIAYDAAKREDLVRGVDGFLNDSVVIPPGEIDSKRLISDDEIKRALRKRRKAREPISDDVFIATNSPEHNVKSVQKADGKGKYCLFSGAMQDVTNRMQYYWSDYRDAFNFQCITSIVFMFFASFAPAITFGGLLGKYTDEKIGIIETLMAQCICGVIWGLLAAQPLMIMSATGPVLVFEASLSTFCSSLELDFLTVRLYSGIWVLLIAFITVACEGSGLLKYVTRFTEDIFACLISIIFIAESLKFIYETFFTNPVLDFNFYMFLRHECEQQIESAANGSVKVTNCGGEPNTALLSVLITLSTCILAYILRQLRQSYYLGRTLRRAIGDFGLLIAISFVATISHFLFPDPYLARLEVPDHLDFTDAEARGHGIIVSAYLAPQQLWAIGVAFIAALLVFILFFVETEITELLLCRKDRGLVKGSGLNWDLLLMGVCNFLCSVLGLPWMCAAAVQSLAHCNSLTVHKKTVPGGRPEVDYVVEQRVTTIGVSLMVGSIAFGGSYLRLPLASLFGVFLYLGVMNLSGVQLVQRFILFFIPEKYFPVTSYTESVNIRRMHLYTGIQIVCLAMVYAVKYFPRTALVFPFVLMLFILLRQCVINRIFTEKELKALDGDDEEDAGKWLLDFYEDVPLPV